MAHVGRVGVGALAGLIAVDVILVALAVQHVRGGDDATAAPPPPTVNETEPGEESAQPEDDEAAPAETTPSEPAGVDVPGEPASTSRTMINMGDDDAVGRAVTGACGEGGGAVELSTDGGVEFTPADLPEEAEVIVRLSVTDPETVRVVGADSDCETYTIYDTSDGGQTWEAEEDSDGAWHLTNRETADVHGPYGTVTASCGDVEQPVIDLSMLSEGLAFALCGDGRVVSTSDAGGTWTDPEESAPVENAVSLDFVDESNGLLVAAGSDTCAGLAVWASEDGGASWVPRSCIETSGSGLADVSATGDSAYVAHEGDAWFSSDSGENWEQRATG